MSERVETLGAILKRARWEVEEIYPEIDDECAASAFEALDIVEKYLPLTARIIPGPTCETCGGDGKCPHCKGSASLTLNPNLYPNDNPGEVSVPCPHCTDGACPACHGEQPVWIVTAEAWEAFVCSIAWLGPSSRAEAERPVHPDVRGEWWARMEAEAIPHAAALLGGGVEVAKQVGVVRCDLSCGADQAIVLQDGFIVIHHGDRIALLERRTG